MKAASGRCRNAEIAILEFFRRPPHSKPPSRVRKTGIPLTAATSGKAGEFDVAVLLTGARFIA